MFRDSRGAIPCTAEELFEQIEDRGDVGGFMEFHKGIKELLGAGVGASLHQEGIRDAQLDDAVSLLITLLPFTDVRGSSDSW